MINLFSSFHLPLTIYGEGKNHLNGGDAESYAAGKLVNALKGEIRWGSRIEDGRKVDLILSYEHPWSILKEISIIPVQVKSGTSYGKTIKHGVVFKKKVFESTLRSTHHIVIVWVDLNSGRLFWTFVHNHSLGKELELGKHHELSPATRYDIARCLGRFIRTNKGGEGITISLNRIPYKHSDTKDESRRINWKKIRRIYNEKKKVGSPVLGTIEVTSSGYRHMFKSSNNKDRKKISMYVIPYISSLLSQIPSSHKVKFIGEERANKFTINSREHILNFDKVDFSGEGSDDFKGVTAKITEQISYPSNWDRLALTGQIVTRRVILKSIYCR